MAKTVWGLDFGNWSLKVVRAACDRKSETITVDLYDEFVYGELPCGYEAGPVEKHRESVIAFQNKYSIESGEDLCVSVTGNEVFSRFINLPPVPENLDQIIRYEARQQIPFDVNDVVWDYQPVKEEHELGEEIEVGLFALKKETVSELVDLLEPWRANLRVVQNAPLAVYNFLHYEGMADSPLVVLDIGAAATDVVVLNPPRFWMRSLLVAGNDLTSALVERLGVSVEEAEKIKQRVGRSAHREQILRTLQPVFDDITNEVQRSLGYYKSLARDVRFERIMVLGNAVRLKGMEQALGAGLQYEVVTMPAPKRLQVAPSVERERFEAALPGACAALGLIVQGAQLGRIEINMVPEEIAFAGAMAKKRGWLLSAAAGLLVAVLLLVGGERLYAGDIQRVEQNAPWGVVDQVKRLEEDFTAEMQKTRELRTQIQQLIAGGVDSGIYLDLLAVLSQTLPSDVYLTSLSINWGPEPTPGGRSPVGGGDKLIVRFGAESHRIRGGKEYIEGVLESLREATYPGTDRQVFSKVQMIGERRDIWRNAATGAETQPPVGGALQGTGEVLRFNAFEAYAVVNTSGQSTQP